MAKLEALNRRQLNGIDDLRIALEKASAKLADQARLIARLKSEVTAGRDSLEKAEQRIRDARQELASVEHKLDGPLPDSSSGACQWESYACV